MEIKIMIMDSLRNDIMQNENQNHYSQRKARSNLKVKIYIDDATVHIIN